MAQGRGVSDTQLFRVIKSTNNTHKAAMGKNDHLFKEEYFQIISACRNVHDELRCGFLEPV